MCEWGTTVPLTVTVPASHSYTGQDNVRVKPIDSCIAPIVEALNAAGVSTVASCCGHGKRPGVIVLRDGREIVICPDYETGRRVDAIFPGIGE